MEIYPVSGFHSDFSCFLIIFWCQYFLSYSFRELMNDDEPVSWILVWYDYFLQQNLSESSGFFRIFPDFSGFFRNFPVYSGIFRNFPRNLFRFSYFSTYFFTEKNFKEVYFSNMIRWISFRIVYPVSEFFLDFPRIFFSNL